METDWSLDSGLGLDSGLAGLDLRLDLELISLDSGLIGLDLTWDLKINYY